jgi:aminoglycoside phosphotransferase (APT) family kinase protein
VGEAGGQRMCARPIHGDFYADQVLIDAGAAALIDLDNAVLGDPCADMGSFAAHLYTRGCDEPRVSRALDALLGGYGRGLSRRTIDLYTAAGLLRRAPEAFRYRADNWPATLATALARAEEITAYDTVAS